MKNSYHLKLNKFTERISPILVQLFDFTNEGYQCERLADYLRSLGGQHVKITIEEKVRPKSREALGFYWGAIVRATALELKQIEYDPNQLAEEWRHYRKLGTVTIKDLDTADKMLRLEFFNEKIFAMGGIQKTIPKTLADKDNPELLKFIDKVQLWRDENQLPRLDPEKYRENRDSARLKRGYVSKEIDYPKEILKPTI